MKNDSLLLESYKKRDIIKTTFFKRRTIYMEDNNADITTEKIMSEGTAKENEQSLEEMKEKVLSCLGMPKELIDGTYTDPGTKCPLSVSSGTDFGSGDSQAGYTGYILYGDQMAPLYTYSGDPANYADDINLAAKEELACSLEEDAERILNSMFEPEPELTESSVPDHDPKYDRDVTEANKKMANISLRANASNLTSGTEVPENPEPFSASSSGEVILNQPAGYRGRLGDKDVVKRNGKVFHRRTASVYRLLWKYFLEQELVNFSNNMGYGRKEIEAIGWKKFIDINDWMTVEDVARWKTDAIHVVPCSHCKQEFTTYEMDFGLCDNCIKLYDITALAAFCAEQEEKEQGIFSAILAVFYVDENFRGKFLKEEDPADKTEKEDAAKSNAADLPAI
jgi:hypothetical protein